MPKNKFNSFYYGVGLKLDEASVEKAGQQLEGRLNQVVDRVIGQVSNLSDALSKGIGHLDTKELVESLSEAKKELGQFQNFDPSKLQNQINELSMSVKALGDNLGEVTGQLESFTKDITTRLSNIEIKTSKQAKDILKDDLEDAIGLARAFSNTLAAGGKNIDLPLLERYFSRIEKGINSITNSGNPLEDFVDKGLSESLVKFAELLRNIGDPVNNLRDNFIDLTADIREIADDKGISVFEESTSYQLEELESGLRSYRKEIEKYRQTLDKFRRKTDGYAVKSGTEDSKLISNFENSNDIEKSFDAIIAKINEYREALKSMKGEDYLSTSKQLIAFVETVENRLRNMSTKQAAPLIEIWKKQFGDVDIFENKFSVELLQSYDEVFNKLEDKIQQRIINVNKAIESTQREIDALTAQEIKKSADTPARRTPTPKQKVEGIAAEVDIKVKINQEEWRKTINAAITKIEPKVKPFKIKVEATSGKILEQVNKIKNASLVDNRKTGASDVSAFDKRFDSFKTNLERRRNELVEYLKTQWHPALKDAFSFQFEILGIDKKSLTKNIDTYLISMVDVINQAMEKKPIELHSNIDTLIAEIKNKIENLELKGNVNLGAGNIGVPSNAGQIVYVLGGGVQGGASTTQPNIQPTPPSEPPTPVAPTQTNNKKQSKKTSKKEIETAEDSAKSAYEAGKEIIEYYIRLAELGTRLNSIREFADKPITEDMFKDGELQTWVRGRLYTKDDIGKVVAPGKKLTPQELNNFLATMGITEADLAEANTKEETEFLGPLKKYIYGFMQNRQELNSLLQQLTQSQSGKDIIEGYNATGNDKTKYFAENLTSTLKNLMPATPKTKAQQHIADVFKKYNIDLSELPSAQSYAEQWHIIQSQLIGKEGLDFNNLMTDLGQLKGNVGKTYENFMTLLKVSRAYMKTSNSLSEVGKEANLLISGRTELRDKKVKKQNPVTGLWEETEEWKQIPKTVQQGIRGMLKSLQVVFENEVGRALLGYNLGQGYLPNAVLQNSNDSFTKIARVLKDALLNSSQILFGKRMSSLKGNTTVSRFEPPTENSIDEPYQFTSGQTQKGQITKWIAEINRQKSQLELELKEINKQFGNIVKPENRNKIIEIFSKIQTKQIDLEKYNEKILAEKNKIDELSNSLTNPEIIYEDIVERLIQAEDNLLNLKKELSGKKKNQKSGTYDKEIEDLQTKISAQENTIKSLTNSADIANRSASDEKANNLIAQEEEKLKALNEHLASIRENTNIKQKQEEIERLKNEQQTVVNRINALRNENQNKVLESRTQEINKLVEENKVRQEQITSLEAEVAPHNTEVSFLSEEIKVREKYIRALKDSLARRKKAPTQESIIQKITERSSELNKLQEEKTQLENELQSLMTELNSLGSFKSLSDLGDIIQRFATIDKRIANLNTQLTEHEKNLKTANNKKVTYSKSYNQAVIDLPRAQEMLSTAKIDSAALQQQYNSVLMPFMANLTVKKNTGEIGQNAIDELIKKLPLLEELNKQLLQGKITEEDYTKRITEAYIILRNATTDEAKATAESDAKKLKNATLLVQKLQEEETILKKIIRTQKPKQETHTQPQAQIGGTSGTASQQPTSTQSIISGASTVTVPDGNVIVGGGVLTGSGLATENTVNKIYELLSIKRNGNNSQYDSRIEEIKKVIAAKEAEERAALETTKQKTSEEKKGTAEVKRKTAEEKKGADSAKKKVTSQEKKTTSQSDTKTTQEKTEAEKKATKATQERTEAEKKATDTTNKKNNKQPNKNNTLPDNKSTYNSNDFLEQAKNKNIKEFFQTVKKEREYISQLLLAFREHVFNIGNDVVQSLRTGTHSLTQNYSNIVLGNISGHIHPRNSLYSAQDFKSIIAQKDLNPQYDTDMLITPDYVYQLKNINKITNKQIDEIRKKFELLEDAVIDGKPIPEHIKQIAKESFLHQYASDYGLQYSKHTINSDGTLNNITSQVETFTKETIDNLFKYIDIASKKKIDSGQEYARVQKEKKALLNKIYQDKLFSAFSSPEGQEWIDAYNKQGQLNKQFAIHGTAIQNAIDNNWDLKLFFDNLCELLDAIKKAGAIIPETSPLYDIMNVVENENKKATDITEKSKIMDIIKPKLIEYFGYQKDFIPDIRNKKMYDKKGIVYDWNKAYGDLSKYKFDDISNDLQNKTLSELRNELVRLEGLRDEGQVDPRFATAAKQDIIIDLLKNGVKIVGKGATTDSESTKKESKKQEQKKNTEAQTINTARKEVDSSESQASTSVKDTGDYITKTAQKCGAEILNVTKSVKDGVESTTVSMNNDYETAMRKTQEQITSKAKKGLFGALYDENVDSRMTSAQAALNSYNQAYTKLQELITKFKQLDLSTNIGKSEAFKLQPQIDDAQKELDQLESQLIDISSATEKFLGGKEPFGIMSAESLDQTGISLKLLAQNSENAMVAFNGLYNGGTKLLYDVFDPTTSSFKRYSLEVDKATGYVRKMETAETGLVNAFQNVNKVQRQSADISAIGDVNQEATLIKKYQEAKQILDNAVNTAWTTAKQENRLISLDEQKNIYALSNEVLRLGQRIISTAKTFKNFRDQGGQSFELVRNEVDSLETSMRQLATDNALDNKMSIGNFSYNDAGKKLSYDLIDLYGNVRKVTMSYVEMFNQVKVTSDNSVATIDKVSKTIQDNGDKINKAVDEGLIDTRTDKYTEYLNKLQDVLNYREQLEASDDRLTQNEIGNLNMRKEAVVALGAELIALANKNKVSMGQGSKSIQNEINQQVGINGRIDRDTSGNLVNTTEYQAYITAYNAMIDKQEEFRRTGILAGENEQKQLASLAEKTAYARKQFEKLSDASARFAAKIKQGNFENLEQDFDIDNQDAVEATMKQFVLKNPDLTSAQKKMIEDTWEFKNAQDGATYSMQKGTDQVIKMGVEMDRGSRQIGQYAIETTKYANTLDKFMGSLKNKWQELLRYLATFGSFYQVINMLKQGVQYVKEIDIALTELKKVTNETEETYDRFLQTASKTADKVGSTIKEIVSSTADWSRLGYSMEDAANLAESTSVLLNVSEFSSIDDATSALISTMQAFGYAAKDSMHVVDVMNEIGNNYAVSSDGIATALQDSASSLMAANNSYQEAVSLIAAANKVVQDPNSVGAALRTISLRLRGTSTKE